MERKRKQDEERFHKELEKDLTLRILYRDSNDMPYIGCQVNLLGCSYYRMLIDFSNGVLKNVIQKMQASNIPPSVWALMQDLGVDDVGLHVAMHNIQYGLNVDRSNWKITSDTLRLLELTYARGRATVGLPGREFHGHTSPANIITGAPTSQMDTPKRQTDPGTKQLVRRFKERHSSK